MNYKTANFTIAALAVWLGAMILPASADEIGEKGREIFKKYQHAVVTVQVVLKTSYSGAPTPNESKRDITGSVIDPSGLTVVALSACDPTEMYQRMMGDAYSKYKVESEITDMKVLLDDGTELPAEIVLRDKDLDLAFLRPKTKPTAPMAALDLSHSSTAQMLDQVIALNRLNSAAGRAYSASVERISALIQKPRTFYIPDSTMTATGLGSPVFSTDGNVVGMILIRTVSGRGGSTRNYNENMTSIILPAQDILQAAKQAPEAKGDSEKKEAPKEPAPTK
jgi:S1-C subfamily serine protease